VRWAPAVDDPVDQKIARFLHDTLPRGASGSLVAARDGEIVHCEGFGMADREARIAAGCDTVYDVMSMTKQFTAAAILKLEMMGKLDVTDPIGTYVGPAPADRRARGVDILRARGRRTSGARFGVVPV
jgi:CubicO group peptidase (beta-lactamase class C family)